jgi:phosphate transport system substrate-binding protein
MITFRRPVLGWIILLSLLFFQQAHAVTEIGGAGATFPLPILKQWIASYESNHPVKINYKAVGSAEGIKSITARTVDFAITDIGLTRSELSQDDLLQFPLVAGGIVPVVNLPGVQSAGLKLTGEVLADIFMGKIAYWDDVRIQSLNPTLVLGHLAIKVIHRKDGSGSTFTFTNYLSKVSEAWEQSLGMGSTLNWPVGEARMGNEGVAKSVSEVEGAIGYVEYLYAERSKLATINLKNKDGYFVAPSPASFAQAFQQASWKRASYYESLTNLPGANSWPIVAVSYALIHRTNNDYEEAKKTLDFLDWIYSSAKNQNDGYISIIDPALIKRIKVSWKEIKDSKGNTVLK